MKTYVLERSQLVHCSRREVFEFFSDASNLELITPGFLRFRILTLGAIEMAVGAIIDYEIRLLGVPLQWRTLIEKWSPEDSFVDVQIHGPYASWRHTHSFADRGDGSVRVSDRVEYSMPFGLLGRVAHALVVRFWLRRIFNHRAEMTRRFLDGPPQAPAQSQRSLAALQQQ